MNNPTTPKRLCVAIALICAQACLAARAQAPAAPAEKPEEAKPANTATKAEPTRVEAVVVTGIRASLEKSLDVKKTDSANVEVITAEDVGKMPDKNLADSLQRLVGVAVRTDYDEAEKVSLRGTNPDMSLILFNGHTVSGGDWYISDQLSSSRSTSLSLMPSSVLNQAKVYKTSQANIVDGGLAGTINVTTRKPLDNRKRGLSGVVNVGGVHADLPGKSSEQLNASLDWVNGAGTLGFIGQVFSEKRSLRRDSASRFAYGTNSGWGEINTTTMRGITDASLAGSGYRAADLNGVRLPGSMSTEFVEGVRDRKGGMFVAQFKPMAGLDLSVTAFNSEMGSNNYGRLTSGGIYSMLLGFNDPLGATTGTNFTSSGGQRVYARIINPVIVDSVSNYGFPLRVLRSATIVFDNGVTPQYVGNSEGFYRDGASASSGFIDFDAKWRINERMEVKALISTTKGVGQTNRDQGATFARFGRGITYSLNGSDSAPDWQYIGAGTNTPGLNADGSGYRFVSFGAASVETIDKESNAALDGTYNIEQGVLTTLEFGARIAKHDRELKRTAPARRSATLPQIGSDGVQQYPSNFGSGLGGNFDNTGFYYSSGALRDFINSQIRQTTPEYERRVAGEIDLKENQNSAYLMQSFEMGKWTGNLGVRFVETQALANIVVPVRAGLCQRIEPGKTVVPCAAVPGAIVTASDGVTVYDPTVAWNPNTGTIYYKTPTDRRFRDVLPSLNVRGELARNLILRLAGSKTIGRQNYNIWGSGFGTPTCSASGCTVTGPNPNLKPLYAKNYDASLMWYFNRRSVLGMNLFKSDITGYAKTGAFASSETIDLVDPADNVTKPFNIVSSSQQWAKIKGLELIYEQPIALGFGITTNFSRAKTKVEDGRPMLGASDKAANVGVYFENDKISTRLVYNYRDKYVLSSTAPAPTTNSQGLATINGVVQPTALFWQAPVSNVALSFNYSFTKDLRLAFDATNLLNPARAQYRYSEEEPQKIDISGRQYYLSLRYRF
jgi:iron complex outermembrane recepter protein